MELTGQLEVILPLQQGESARGPWQSQDFVLLVPGQHDRRLVFTVFGEERLQRFAPALRTGERVTVYFDIDAHEWKDRWFNEIRAYDVRLAQ